ncbi:MAG: HD-GYP domain-containing protein [Planctomycetales bacterium]|nr:HD-GYP domain-containing protein [Planctomycetales bacterium]
MTTTLENKLSFRGAGVFLAHSEVELFFGMPFTMWVRKDAWQAAPLDIDSHEAEAFYLEAVATWLNACGTLPAEPELFELESGTTVLAVPIRENGRLAFVATTVVDTDRPELVLRLAHAFLREWESEQEMEALRSANQQFAEQVTRDLEELAYLREMTQSFEIVDLSTNLFQMARIMLPLLNNSIRAKGLFLVSAEHDSHGLPRVGRVVSTHGPDPVPPHICQTITRLYFTDVVLGKPVVRNRVSTTPDANTLPGVDELAIASVMNSRRTLGWLVAVNLQDPEHVRRETRWALSQHEFGTSEASLLATSASILAAHASNIELLREQKSLLINVVRSLVLAIDAKDEYTRGHSERVALYGQRLAKQLGCSATACERIYLTGLLHDVGKIGVSDAVLKKPGRLTDDEFEEIKQHPDEGWAILNDLEQMRYVLPGVLYHHERFDGKGYPDHLAGEEIPLDGRILAVADAFDAMTSDRPYRQGMAIEKAIAILRDGTGTQWDPRCVNAFLACQDDLLKIKESYVERTPALRTAPLGDDPTT